MSKLRRYLSCLILGICAVILIVACDRGAYLEGNHSSNSPTSNPVISANSESCRLVSHQMGETKVCGQPQKVAALSPFVLDSMLALGVQPSAYAEVEDLKIQTYDNPLEQIPYIGKWVTTQPRGLGDCNSPSLERLTLVKPDLILGEAWQVEDEYPLLTQIASTLLFSNQQANGLQGWQHNIQKIAKALDREAKVKELLSTFSQQVTQARIALQPVLENYPRVLLINSNLTTYVASQPESTTSRLLQEIGFRIVEPPGIRDYAEISWEILPQIETDIILVLSWSDDSFSNPENILRHKWAKNSLLSSMPVFQQGRVYFVDYQLWGSNIGGPLTDQLILEALPDLLLSSVNKKNSA
ncbi:iron-siderophore ABC transporter substrate-binding protein [Pleurocapsa sp. CCALA 161]|uniref:ABC transporter substrate-binding protein n=1 Tax=Pleurocapsa sp. CCALA 161 TaxID=2107688 RepID=UPI000D051E6D|nr:iron-siderophore ABC transporter substrate-binding protein [Pleurocapsa sp. CCALA 161]PSB11076.1 iron-siderophore ABC transporter substrate-binding protein [Pleurocapsa sp. CCALA 161]